MKIDPDELADLELDQRLERRYLAALARHPDCRDPAHPGCERCGWDDEDDSKHEKAAA